MKIHVYYIYMQKYANIHTYIYIWYIYIYIYIYIRNFTYICVIHYLPPTLSQYLFPIKFQPPSTHTPSSRNQGRPWSSLGQNIKPQRSLKWSNLRVVDLALKQAAKRWVSTSTIADCFQTCLGDKSATLNLEAKKSQGRRPFWKPTQILHVQKHLVYGCFQE